MLILYNDEHSRRPGESFYLMRLTSGWHIVARGYLCRVNDEEEGRRLIVALQAHRNLQHMHIDKA